MEVRIIWGSERQGKRGKEGKRRGRRDARSEQRAAEEERRLHRQ